MVILYIRHQKYISIHFNHTLVQFDHALIQLIYISILSQYISIRFQLHTHDSFDCSNASTHDTGAETGLPSTREKKTSEGGTNLLVSILIGNRESKIGFDIPEQLWKFIGSSKRMDKYTDND